MKIGVIGTGRLGICFSLILSKYLEEVNVYDKNLEYLKLIDEVIEYLNYCIFNTKDILYLNGM